MRKQFKIVIKLFIASFLVCFVVIMFRYVVNAGTFTNTRLDLEVLSDENPVRRKQGIELATTATVTVASLDKYKALGVTVSFEDYPEIYGTVWLSEDDIAKIDVGDRITVKGNVKYYEDGSPYIVIGDAIAVFPYMFEAKLLEVEKR